MRTWRIGLKDSLAAALLAFWLASCAKTPPVTAPSGAPPTGPGGSTAAATREVRANENLHAVLWAQTAVEFKAVAIQAFLLARDRLDRALADPSWTAALEQEGDFSKFPPAVIVDIDETVLDNAVFQARLTRTNQEYQEAAWRDWVREVSAEPIPGAVEFARYAQEKGVAVFYVTNRNHEIEEPTRRNLEAWGFPVEAGRDTVLTQAERPEWQSSDKSPRRRAVAADHRVLLLIGDDFGDFVPARVSLAERATLFERYASNWGNRWIVLPNPSYGSWEGTLFDFKYELPREQKLKIKESRLRVAR
jgi:acid phosphatase